MLESLSELSLLSQLALVFVAGIGTSLTPCVYPLIPVTLALFGADEGSPRSRSFFLALTYVSGIAVTFCILGLLSASTGAIFGSILSYPPVVITLAILMFSLAGSSLDLFHIPYLHNLQGRASRVGSVGFKGAFLAGTVSGLVASPCVGPALVAILVFVAQSGDMARGTLLLLSFALGMGLLFIVLGTYSNLLSRIPRSGHWMNIIKYIMAVALCFYALFLLQSLLPLEHLALRAYQATALLWPLLPILCGVAYISYKRNNYSLRTLSCLVTAAALLLILIAKAPEGTQNSDGNIPALTWHHSYQQALQIAAAKKQPVFFDLYADWCVACKELEKITFQDPEVKKLLHHFVLSKIDFTAPNEETEMLSEKYGVVGLPWLFSTDAEGTLIPASVITGFIESEEMTERLTVTLENYEKLKDSQQAETR